MLAQVSVLPRSGEEGVYYNRRCCYPFKTQRKWVYENNQNESLESADAPRLKMLYESSERQ